jgi:hypothetical protein
VFEQPVKPKANSPRAPPTTQKREFKKDMVVLFNAESAKLFHFRAGLCRAAWIEASLSRGKPEKGIEKAVLAGAISAQIARGTDIF